MYLQRLSNTFKDWNIHYQKISLSNTAKYLQTAKYSQGLFNTCKDCKPSTIDLRGAYQQLAVEEESQPLLTMNTPFGLYRFKTLPFGIAPAPSIFQRTKVKLFEGLPVLIYLDDIILATETEQEMKELLMKVLKWMSEFNLRINVEKSRFFLKRVKFLGHVYIHYSQTISLCWAFLAVLDHGPQWWRVD